MSAQTASLADLAAQLSSARRNTPAERRRFRRVGVSVRGRMMDGDGREHDCRTADISPGDARIAAAAAEVRVGDRIVFYLDDLGRLEGHVVRASQNGEFAVIFSGTAHKREKLAELLTWLMSRESLALDEEVQRDRREGGGALTSIAIEHGPAIDGEIVDFSLVGMAVRTRQPAPPLGTWVRVGAIDGKVARYFDGGFAVDFEVRRR